MLKITKAKKNVFALMLVLTMLLTAVGCNSKTALVEDGSPESKSATYTEEDMDTLEAEMQAEIDRLAEVNDALKAAPQENGNAPYMAVQLSTIKSAKSTNDVTAIAWNKSTDLVMSVGQANLRTATTTPAGKKVMYTSSDTKVASVDVTGNVYCLAPGKTVITATSGNKSVSYKLTVTAAKAAPANAAAASAGKSGALVGYNITVYDATTPAVTGAGHTVPIDKYYFYSADGKQLGYMLGNDQVALMGKSKVKTDHGYVAPGCGGNWQAWLAQQFNLYRGLGSKLPANAGGLPNIGSGSSADNADRLPDTEPSSPKSNGPLFPQKGKTDIEALRNEVIRLTNAERKNAGKQTLKADDFTMDYAQIRAEESSASFSHKRPNNGDDMPGGFSFAENIHFGSTTAAGAVKAWMNSTGHRAAILADYSDYGNRFGVGVYQAPNGTLYWVQEFLSWDPEGGDNTDDSYSEEPSNPVNDDSANSIDTYAMALEAVELTNAERRKAGLDELQISTGMMDFAQIRAEEVSIDFSHTRLDGTKITAFGYGENIHSGGNQAALAINSWMNSPGHKANILNKKYKYIGIGYYTGNGNNCWVQLFSGQDKHGNGSAPASSSMSPSTNGSSPTGGGIANDPTRATYSLNETELNLTAGEGYQLSVDTSGLSNDMRVEWSVNSHFDDVIAVDDSGYVTTFHRDGMTSAKATVAVTADVYCSGMFVKSLHCKIIVTQ